MIKNLVFVLLFNSAKILQNFSTFISSKPHQPHPIYRWVKVDQKIEKINEIAVNVFSPQTIN